MNPAIKAFAFLLIGMFAATLIVIAVLAVGHHTAGHVGMGRVTISARGGHK